APNVAIAEFTFSGTMQGDIGPFKATKKPIVIHGVDVDVMKDGKYEGAVTYSNGMELLAQIGALPKPKPPAAPGAKPATPKPAPAPAPKPAPPKK
ncbi:MAG TPA: hypothetical protein VGM56_17310, partial [Byssovorax sp.]